MHIHAIDPSVAMHRVERILLLVLCLVPGNEFDSRHAIDVHRRHSSAHGTPCADPRNHKSMSMTGRGDQAAGILRQHDTLGVLPIPDVCFAQKKAHINPP